jgi:outer membrane receptor protein involved in Fe transport
MKLDITGTLGKSFNVAANGGEQNSSTDYLITPEHITENIGSLNFNDSRVFLDSYWSLSTVKNYSLNALFTHVLGSKAFYEVRVEHVAREYDTGTPAPRDQTKKYELFPGYFVDETPFGWDSLALSGVSGMLLGGHTATARDSSKISSTSLKGSLVAQLDGHNQVKAGVEFVYNQLNLEYGVVNKAFPESNNFVHEARFPIRGALFVQDKLEFEGFIANLGLRLDYSNSNVDWWAVSQFDKSFYTFSFDPSKEYPKEKAKAAWSLSPRLGISHPITENAKLFFNYGHFKQLPTYEQLLRYSRNVTGTLRNIGDPDLLMASTIAYELGFDYSLFDEYLVQIAGFYRDITDQQDFTTYISNAASGNFQYVKPNNNSYQDIRGVEVTLRKTAGSWVTGFINYTYQSTKSGRFNKDRIYQDFTDQRKYDLDTRILYQFRPIPTPYARMSVTLFTPPDFGPTFGGNSFFGDWAVSILGDWRSGGYQTWNPNNDPSVANNVQVVDFLNFSLRTSKALTFGKTRIILFADISNLFSTKRLNLNSFYDYNDQQDYYNSLHLPAGPGYRNIPGTDKVGDYRSSDVAFQPIEQFAVVSGVGDPHVIYYETTTQRYMNYVNNTWSEVDPGRMQQVLDDKAYIDMPNETSFNFLNPRQIFFGITVALEL